MNLLKSIKLIAGPLSGFICFLLMLSATDNLLMAKMAGAAVWIAVWWIFESVNLYFTALLPLSLFPLLGIMDMKEVAPMYTNEIIFLFFGGFLIAFGLEKWNLHKRIALSILLSVGSSPSRVLLGFMLCGYLISMWISNIATTMMLLPAVLAVAQQFSDLPGNESRKKLTTPFLLGLAYASSIGGTATLIGTAPNMIFMGFFNDFFPGYPPINFTNWMIFGLPVSMIFFILCFFVLRKLFISNQNHISIDLHQCRNDYKQLGKISYEEKVMIALFSITVLLWFFRSDIVIGSFKINGWSNLFPYPKYITDSTIAMVMASILFIVPSKNTGTIISWEEAKKIPIGIIFLFGGGFALAKGISTSGLSEWLAENLVVVNTFAPYLIVLILCFFMTFFTELTSNTAATYLVLPIILALSQNIDSHPLLLMIPVVFSASFAFMLPVATPPNTIIFGSEQVSMQSMVKAGVILNFIGIALITIAIFTLGKWVFGL